MPHEAQKLEWMNKGKGFYRDDLNVQHAFTQED